MVCVVIAAISHHTSIKLAEDERAIGSLRAIALTLYYFDPQARSAAVRRERVQVS